MQLGVLLDMQVAFTFPNINPQNTFYSAETLNRFGGILVFQSASLASLNKYEMLREDLGCYYQTPDPGPDPESALM